MELQRRNGSCGKEVKRCRVPWTFSLPLCCACVCAYVVVKTRLYGFTYPGRGGSGVGELEGEEGQNLTT